MPEGLYYNSPNQHSLHIEQSHEQSCPIAEHGDKGVQFQIPSPTTVQVYL